MPPPPCKPIPILLEPDFCELRTNPDMAKLHKGPSKQLFVALSLEPPNEHGSNKHKSNRTSNISHESPEKLKLPPSTPTKDLPP